MVAPQPFYSPRGTPMNVLQLCRVLTGAGYHVDLLTYPLGRDATMPRLRIHRAPRIPGIDHVPIGFSWQKLPLDAALCFRALTLLVRRRYRLVHAVEESAFLALPLTWLGVPLLYDLDSQISDQLAYSGAVRSRVLLAGIRTLERLTVRRSRAVITMCRTSSDWVRSVSPTVPCFQIEDTPLPESQRAPDPQVVAALRERIGLGDRRAVVYTGNLESYQGIDLLLAAAARLREAVADAVVVVVGGEPEQVEALRKRIGVERLEGAVLAVGERPPHEIPEWMGLADLLVSPRRDGTNTPLKIYTYMQSGVPIVATDLPTHTQVLDATTAVLCEPTPEGLAAGIAWALEKRAEAAGLGKAARERAERHYGPAAFEEKLLAAYSAVIGPP